MTRGAWTIQISFLRYQTHNEHQSMRIIENGFDVSNLPVKSHILGPK